MAGLVVAEKEGGSVAAVWAAAGMGLARAVASWVTLEAHLEGVRRGAAAAGTVAVVTAREVAVAVDPAMAVAAMVQVEEARGREEVATAEGVTEAAGARAMGKVVAAMAAVVKDTAVQWVADSAEAGQSEVAAMAAGSRQKDQRAQVSWWWQLSTELPACRS